MLLMTGIFQTISIKKQKNKQIRKEDYYDFIKFTYQ